MSVSSICALSKLLITPNLTETDQLQLKKVMKLITILLLFGTIQAFAQSLDMNILSVKKPVVDLNGIWKIINKPDKNTLTDKKFALWQDIAVPGELAMQGFEIEYDKPVVYKKQVIVPADYKGQKIVLRFDGVYSYSRLWVNDNFVREHHGGFTRWESDITEWATPGKPIVITREVTDLKDEISFASGYAKHQIGGILRDVTLYSIPQNHISNFVIETDLDKEYNDATLKLSFKSFQKQNATVWFTLTDPQGNIIPISNNKVDLVSGENQKTVTNSISNPVKWDAEHPNLYMLKTELTEEGKEVYSFTERVGFREIEISKNVMLVNGKPVKLRGACRHDIHPTLGRIATDEYDKLDVLLAKEANINFIRTSHYPPSERFLKYCDEYGLYVESESAVCFVRDNSSISGNSPTSNSAQYEQRYLLQFEEMVNTHRNHPSVIMWSLGNESVYGSNIQKCYDWAKKEDTTRPVIFSYPGTVPADAKCYDILSMHYPNFDGNMYSQGLSVRGFSYESMLVIFDEWAHVPCYTNETLRQDPNIREFWGQSLDMMWASIFENQGGLGGSIWCFVDESFMLPRQVSANPSEPLSPDTCVGYGEWGIIDIWRRHKPEFWETKKAYSPIKVLQTEIKAFVGGTELFVPIYNRFNHTNLNETEINISYQDSKIKIEGPDIKPHAKGFVVIPANDWKSDEFFRMEFFEKKSGKMIDVEKITLSGTIPIRDLKSSYMGSIEVEEKGNQIIVKGKDFTIPISKNTGMIEDAVFKGNVLIKSGPYINATLVPTTSATSSHQGRMINLADGSLWKADKVSFREHDNNVVVEIEGSYANAECRIIIQIDSEPNITADFMFMGSGVGFSHELGLVFALNSDLFEALKWERKPYWSAYPENHLGSPTGTTLLYSNLTPIRYRQNPNRDWSLDDKNFYYFGIKGSNVKQPLVTQAKAMKENIKEYSLLSNTKNIKLTVTSSDNSVACRLSKPSDHELMLNIDTYWDYPEIVWGNYSKSKNFDPFTGRISFHIQ